jgi:hypothetical protein
VLRGVIDVGTLRAEAVSAFEIATDLPVSFVQPLPRGLAP